MHFYFSFKTGGESHGGFEQFLCFGEGIFSDCVDRDRVVKSCSAAEQHAEKTFAVMWPGGDDPEEDEIDEEVNIFTEMTQHSKTELLGINFNDQQFVELSSFLTSAFQV